MQLLESFFARRLAGIAAAAALAILLAPGPARAAASRWAGNQYAAVRLITAERASGSASIVDAGLEIQLAPGWHAYWRDPGAAGIPPSITWQGSRNLAATKLAWPAPRRFSLDGLQTYGYAGQTVLPIAVTLAKPGAPLVLHATVAYSACRNICVPIHAVLRLTLPAGIAAPGPEAGLIAAARAAVPGSLAGLGLSVRSATVWPNGKGGSELAVSLTGPSATLALPDLFVEGLPHGAPGPPHVARAADGDYVRLLLTDIEIPAARLAGRNLVFTVTNGPDHAATFAALPVMAAPGDFAPAALLPLAVIAAAFFGGLLLNVMPCVLPVLSLKLISLARLAGAERRTVRLELMATAGGIVFGFLVLAAGLIALKEVGAAIGWGIQFQSPWFLIAMTIVMVLFAADLWGWIAIAMPGANRAAAMPDRVHGRHASAFLVGLFATFLSTSCTAPFLGTAVGFALSRGPLEITAIFLAMGVGLGAPTLTAAAAPSLVALLPRPGRWMVWLSRIFGALLLATAVWLLTVLARVSGLDAALTVAGLALVLLGLLAARRWAGGRLSGLRRAGAGLAGAVVVAALLVPLVGIPGHMRRTADQSGIWHPFVRSAIAPNVTHGRTVLVNVTAAWCLICQVNEVTVLDRNPVAARIGRADVLAMRADWTKPNAGITDYLQSFGRYGVPLDVIYGPGAPGGIVLPDLITAPEVIKALNRAAGVTRDAER
ncbi:MAG: protein-disulfide reductase DsbD family protein [Acetobacteraceae bacterium]